MIDNCSTTARLGARKWAPALPLHPDPGGLPRPRRPASPDEELIEQFVNNAVHPVLAVCAVCARRSILPWWMWGRNLTPRPPLPRGEGVTIPSWIATPPLLAGEGAGG